MSYVAQVAFRVWVCKNLIAKINQTVFVTCSSQLRIPANSNVKRDRTTRRIYVLNISKTNPSKKIPECCNFVYALVTSPKDWCTNQLECCRQNKKLSSACMVWFVWFRSNPSKHYLCSDDRSNWVLLRKAFDQTSNTNLNPQIHVQRFYFFFLRQTGTSMFSWCPSNTGHLVGKKKRFWPFQAKT